MEDTSMAWRRRAPLHYAVRMERLDHPCAYPSLLPLIVGPANLPAVVEGLSVIVHVTIRFLAVGKEAAPMPTPTHLMSAIERAWSAAEDLVPDSGENRYFPPCT